MSGTVCWQQGLLDEAPITPSLGEARRRTCLWLLLLLLLLLLLPPPPPPPLLLCAEVSALSGARAGCPNSCGHIGISHQCAAS